jgi:hypothetical protein
MNVARGPTSIPGGPLLTDDEIKAMIKQASLLCRPACLGVSTIIKLLFRVDTFWELHSPDQSRSTAAKLRYAIIPFPSARLKTRGCSLERTAGH